MRVPPSAALKCFEDALRLCPEDKKINKEISLLQRVERDKVLKAMINSIITDFKEMVTDSLVPIDISSLAKAKNIATDKSHFKQNIPFSVIIEAPRNLEGHFFLFHYHEEGFLDLVYPRKKTAD